MNIADDLPQGSGVLVGTGVKVGVGDGGIVAVLVASAVGDSVGDITLDGGVQAAKIETSRIQERSFNPCRQVGLENDFMDGMDLIEQVCPGIG
jgi:hypothetical protein